MAFALAGLVVIVVLFALGFSIAKFLLVIAAIALVLWLLGFPARRAESRWYRW